jgi:FkbM family methyltransferase
LKEALEAALSRVGRLEGMLAQATTALSQQMREMSSEVRSVLQSQTVYLGDHRALTYLATGQKIFVDTRSIDIGTHLMLGGSWEPNYTTAFQKLLAPGAVVLDIGANHGFYSLTSVPHILPDGHIYAFEPSRSFYDLMCRSVSVNGYDSWITIENAALGEEPGEVDLVFDPNWSGGANIANQALPILPAQSKFKFESEKVRCLVGDEFFKERPEKVDAIKMDVEGAEGIVLAGMSGLVDRSPQVKIMMEFCPAMLNRFPRNAEFVAEFFSQRGFHCWKIGVSGEFIPTQWSQLLGETDLIQNIVLCRQFLPS